MMNRIKTLQELNLLDRFLFSEVMADNETLEDVLEIILGHPVPLNRQKRSFEERRRIRAYISMCTVRILGM